MRTHLCGELEDNCVGQRATVCGWVRARRDHGGVIFMDLRDRSGVLQLVANPQHHSVFAAAEQVRAEYVVQGVGILQRRPEGKENTGIGSGAVELLLDELTILNSASAAAFLPDDEGVSEEARLRFRVLDLRGRRMQDNLRRRAAMATAARRWLEARDFIEIETPFLAPPTPEGARDFIVPSRLQAGDFYALPQSPQLFKQMLMAAGFERYYQIARCFRDEDLRADRQPEFSQIDVEMSFVEEEDVMQAMEDMVHTTFAAAAVELPRPFPRMQWQQAMRDFGTDRPDLRNPLMLADIGDVVRDVDFKVFSTPANSTDGRVTALRLPGGAKMARRDIDALTEFAGKYGAKGLAYIKVEDAGTGAAGASSPILKFLTETVTAEILRRTHAESGDMLFFGAGREDIVAASMSAVRDKLAADFDLLEGGWRPLWITDFPLFERDYDAAVWHARHHPFTAPRSGDEHYLPASPERAGARAYDMILNGAEIGGGSIRIHNAQTQLAMLAALGFDEARARRQFGFLLAALESGAPPHGGIAFGLDRMAALACGAETIRDVTAFPKTQRGQCLLTGAPNAVSARQLKELHIRADAAAEKDDS